MKFTFQPLRSAVAVGFVVTASLVSGCDVKAKVDIAEGGRIAFIEPIIRTPIAGRPTAGYFGYERSYNTTDRIIAVASPAFKRVEMHDSVTEGGMKTMVKLDTLDLPAKSAIKFAPGGKHLMLFEPTKELKDGDQVKVTFVFAEQNPMVITFDVRDVVPITGTEESMDHSRMDHSKMDHGAMNHGDKKP
ncbi:MAG: copper chaperone PCu(A)C [Hyphomonadaceae bacterium]